MPDGLLSGVRILDFSALLPGPFGTVILGDLGADVIKVEPPKGDFARHMPLDIFRMANRNKRGIALDLKHPGSTAIVDRLTQWADVVVEGFRPGVAERIGIGPKRLRGLKPSLVYCSISGFGQTGPWQDRPGHEITYLAAGGGLNFLGHWDDTKPKRSGIPVADLTGSSFLAVSVLAALLRARATGEGATLDISLTEAVMALAQTRRGLDVDDQGRSYLWPTNDLFETSDGRLIALGVIEAHFWDGLVRAMRQEALTLSEPRFASDASRRENGTELFNLLTDAFRRHDARTWLDRLADNDVPATLVLSPREAANSEQAQARDLVRSKDGERHLPFPVVVDGTPGGRLDTLAGSIGQHTAQILTELGYSRTEIDTLETDGAIAMASETSLEHS